MCHTISQADHRSPFSLRMGVCIGPMVALEVTHHRVLRFGIDQESRFVEV